jgi:SPP1 family predicted phage head-tail adaptor
VRSGSLRHRVTIQRAVEASNDLGELVSSWVAHATVWGEIKQEKGGEQLVADHIRSEISTKITIRYLAGVTRDMRVKFGDRYFRIENVYNWQERNRMMILTTSEVMEEETP